jgi:hypothetical protein
METVIINIVLIVWTITLFCFCVYISLEFLEWCYSIFIRLYKKVNTLLFILSFKCEGLSYKERKMIEEVYNILVNKIKKKEND